ncbi:MAG: glycosyl hydrolase family 28 protein [Polyangiaceae bacterium]|jgi:polygalacturonase
MKRTNRNIAFAIPLALAGCGPSSNDTPELSDASLGPWHDGSSSASEASQGVGDGTAGIGDAVDGATDVGGQPETGLTMADSAWLDASPDGLDAAEPPLDGSSHPLDASSHPSDAASSLDATSPGADAVSEDAVATDEDASAPPLDAGVPPDAVGSQVDAQWLAADAATGWNTVPTLLGRIVEPTFPSVDCDITNYGGVGDGVTDNTGAFAAAISACASSGGGKVVVPAGTFFTGPIELKSNINLYVSAGATIKFTTDPTKYLPVVEVSWEGSLAYNYRPLISAHDATNVGISGPGTIDGNATANDWYAWAAKETADQTLIRQDNANGVPPAQRIFGAGHYLRPSLIEFMNCTNVLFADFTAENSPFWTIHPVFCTNVTARGFTSLGSVGNTDGFDPESCVDVLIDSATIRVGDDSIAIKAGRDRDGWTYYTPSENIVIENCTLTSKVGGVAVGSEMSAGVRNVYIENDTFSNATGSLQYALYLKAAVTRGGFISDVYAEQLTVATVSQFFYLTGHYVSGTVVGTPVYTSFNNINVDGATVAKTTLSPFLVAGSDATQIATEIHLSNVTVTTAPTPALDTGSDHYSALTTTNVVVDGVAFNPPGSAP